MILYQQVKRTTTSPPIVTVTVSVSDIWYERLGSLVNRDTRRLGRDVGIST
jgi:hypothetical protein